MPTKPALATADAYEIIKIQNNNKKKKDQKAVVFIQKDSITSGTSISYIIYERVWYAYILLLLKN